MGKEDKGQKQPAATLEILVAYDNDEDIPDDSEIERVIDECKATGRVVRAVWSIHRPITRTFL